jgi:hypothetical protein
MEEGVRGLGLAQGAMQAKALSTFIAKAIMSVT